MKLKCLFFLLIVSFCSAGCNHNQHANAPADAAITTVERASSELDFRSIDSVEFLYYPDPQHQKDFKIFFIKDSLFIKALSQNLALAPVQKEECLHQVKMYLFNGRDVYKTLYASMQEGCRYLAYGVGSQSFFVPLSQPVQQALDSLVNTLQ